MTEENKFQNEQFKKSRRRWKRWWLVPFMFFLCISIVWLTQYLNHTGFCYAEMRYLNERELVDRFLFKDKAEAMTFEEKVAYMKEQRSGTEYPNCCRFDGEMESSDLGFLEMDEFNNWLERTTFGVFLYKTVRYVPWKAFYIGEFEKNIEKEDEVYVSVTSVIDQCGNLFGNIHINNLSEDLYPKWLRDNDAYWKQQQTK